MTEKPDHKTFDLANVLAGREYPELRVPIYLNEALGFSLKLLQEGLEVAVAADDEKQVKKLQSELKKLLKEVEGEKYTVVMQAVPESVKGAIIEQIIEDFPEERDFLGQVRPNLDREKAYMKATWRAFLREVISPDGAIAVVDEKAVENLQSFAPAPAINAINEGIDKLTSGAAEGFEFAAKEVNFL